MAISAFLRKGSHREAHSLPQILQVLGNSTPIWQRFDYKWSSSGKGEGGNTQMCRDEPDSSV